MKPKNFFLFGFREMLPVTTGVIPFGAVVGTICSEAGLSIFESLAMNILVYAGAAQLAATELMMKHAAGAVVIATGLIINLRFLLYSAALAPVLQRSRFLVKLACAYCLTDQGYAVMSANRDKFRTHAEEVRFYLGTAACMMLAWHGSFLAGYIFGNFAPASWSLDYGVPLSFAALVIPTLKNRKYVSVALFSSVVSIGLSVLPLRIGLVLTALLSIGLAIFLTRPRRSA